MWIKKEKKTSIPIVLTPKPGLVFFYQNNQTKYLIGRNKKNIYLSLTKLIWHKKRRIKHCVMFWHNTAKSVGPFWTKYRHFYYLKIQTSLRTYSNIERHVHEDKYRNCYSSSSTIRFCFNYGIWTLKINSMEVKLTK